MPLKPDDPLLALVSPPRVERFRALVGLSADEPLSVDFSGWSKLVLLSHERAFLFPRDHTQVEALKDEVEALRAVAPARLREIPELLGEWTEPRVSPYPIVALRRLPGVALEGLLPGLGLDALARLMEQLGRLAARWHDVDPTPLAARGTRDLPHRRALDELLGTRPGAADPGALAADICTTLGLERAMERRARAAILRARGLSRVLVHGDVHEGQIMVSPDDFAVSGILDWQTAWVDHPFAEPDLGQWGEPIWRLHRTSFPELRRRYWRAYAAERALPGDLEAVFEWSWAVSHALRLARADGANPREDVLGSAAEARARVHEATRLLPDS